MIDSNETILVKSRDMHPEDMPSKELYSSSIDVQVYAVA